MAEYKIKDIETLTGIKAHTIRIWEKRYAILEPNRTQTQIRTYSDEDLVSILNIALLNKSGVKISRISEMSQREILQRVQELSQTANFDTLFENLLLALMNLDEDLFKHTLDVIQKEKGFDKMYSEYLTTFLDRIGVLWLAGTIHPGQEHFISNLIRQRLMSEIEKLPAPSKEHVAILFLPDNEWHELGLMYYHYYLRKNGVYSFFLGQSTPVDAVLDCVDRFHAKAVITSCVAGVNAHAYKNALTEIARAHSNLLLYAGGLLSSSIADMKDATIQLIQSSTDLEELVEAIKKA